jgi:hypothetical protein
MWTSSKELGEQLRCDQCMQSLDQGMNVRFPTREAALSVAHSFGWVTGDTVTCPFCQSFNKIMNSSACPTCAKPW